MCVLLASKILMSLSESKPLEHRSALTPTTTKALIEAGYKVKVEQSQMRIFDDDEFSAVGAELVEEGSWVSAPSDEIIIGLKELPLEPKELPHVHVQFAHVFKNQDGWQDTLARYSRGNGTLLDLEFLSKGGRRVAAFGFHAGFSGAALAIKAWIWNVTGHEESLPGVKHFTNGRGYYDNETLLTDAIRQDMASFPRKPRVLILGALGRCGGGAVQLCKDVGLPTENIVQWDMAETQAKAGPYPEIIESDIFINCIYLDQKIPPFVNIESLEAAERRNLSVVCDVSCDTTNPNNPIPIYTENSTFDTPTIPVHGFQDPPLSVISIDHLPSLLPREASEAFSEALLPYLQQLNAWRNEEVWQDAEKLYMKKVNEMQGSPTTTVNGHSSLVEGQS